MPRTGFLFSRTGRYLLAAASAAVALTAVTGGSAMASGPAPGRLLPLVVRTDHGLVRGFREHGAREFLGIPYAAPPTGANQWRPPQPFPPWPGIRPATRPGHDCAQTGSIATGVPSTSTFENCLFLNVYTPPRAGRLLPVMIWIHGGGFTGGAGRIYDGAMLAARRHVIVVTINYRLSAFGFLALPSLDAESPDNSSGDYGLMDQQAAMRWVQDNAFAFGGDPGNVTIFGESAGGASVCANMASPTAFGLFSRAIAESGCIFPAQSRKAAERQGTALARKLGCTHPATAAACMRTKPAAAILKAEPSTGLLAWGPVAGGVTLPLNPIKAFETGHFLHVPLLQGSNLDEGELFVGLEFDLIAGHPLTAAQYPKVVTAQFGAKDAKAVLAHYPLSKFPSPDLAYAQVLTDSEFSCPALLTDILTQHSGAYAYEFSDPHPPNDFGVKFSFPLGPAHSTELQYVFGRIPFLDTIPPFTAAQFALSAQMMGYWTRFAATGNPNGGKAPDWPRFGGGQPRIQELLPSATAPEAEAVFAGAHQCAFWATIEGPGLPRLAPALAG